MEVIIEHSSLGYVKRRGYLYSVEHESAELFLRSPSPLGEWGPRPWRLYGIGIISRLSLGAMDREASGGFSLSIREQPSCAMKTGALPVLIVAWLEVSACRC